MEHKEYWEGVATGILGAAVIAAGGFLGYIRAVPEKEQSVLSDSAHVQKLEYLESLIDEYYLEEKDEEKLTEGLYAGLIYGLSDPYSRYYTAEEYEKETTGTEGSYVGVGILIGKNPGGGAIVSKCYEGGPADAAGIMDGDVISAVDGQDVTEMELDEIVDLIKNNETGSVLLTIHREDQEQMEVRTEISDVELPSVFYEMLDDEIGYIRISEFTGVTPGQYEMAFQKLEEQGMKELIVDLRNNPGGLLDSVCSILNDILPEGLIVYTEDKYGNREEEHSDGEHPLEIPLAVLVNGSSASASEIFAGAVQDYGVGTIVGTTTYGKGVVQSIRMLSDGSAVKLTSSRYYTPNGNNIHNTGITPDVEVKPDASLLNQTDISHEEDNQLQAAISVLNEGKNER